MYFNYLHLTQNKENFSLQIYIYKINRQHTDLLNVDKGGLVEETLVYMIKTYSKFEFSHQITEIQAFVLVSARKTTEY